MSFYDLHVHSSLSIGESTTRDVIEMAKKLNLAGVGIVRYHTNIEELPESDIDVVNAVMVKADSAQSLLKIGRKLRPRVEVLMVHGGDYDVNRAACENSLFDVLCHPELGRTDSGLDHIAIKAAAENDVAIELNFRLVLESYRKKRMYILSSMKKNVRLCGKYEAPVIVTSGSVSRWGMRGGRELAALAGICGMDLGDAINATSAVPEKLVQKNREKLAGKRWEGVKVN